MDAFWWYKENAVAGMARPGFNRVHWLELPFDEATLFGWIGLYTSGSIPITTFRAHLQTYAPLIFRFHKLDDVTGPAAVRVFETEEGILDVAKRIRERTGFLESLSIDKGVIHFEMSRARLSEEMEFLKSRGIRRIVSLTESHHCVDDLSKSFDLHHISIPDMAAPNREQAEELAKILSHAKSRNESVAVHCLAGIGRTSTMIMAAHILNGDDPIEVRATLERQNPRRSLTPVQFAFIDSL